MISALDGNASSNCHDTVLGRVDQMAYTQAAAYASAPITAAPIHANVPQWCTRPSFLVGLAVRSAPPAAGCNAAALLGLHGALVLIAEPVLAVLVIDMPCVHAVDH